MTLHVGQGTEPTGKVPNAPSINSSACNNSTHICKVDTVYDQTGNGFDISQSTDANRPVFVVDGYTTGIPCMSFSRSGGGTWLFTTTGATPTQPFLTSAVANFNAGAAGDIWGASTAQLLQGASGANTVNIYASGASGLNVTLTDGTWGAINGIYNAGSSYLRVNSTTGSGVNIGSSGGNVNNYVGAYDGIGTNLYDGKICEFGIASTGTNSVADALNTNQHSSGRYNF